MAEYIVRETDYPGHVKQEIVGELVRCKDCKNNWNGCGYCEELDLWIKEDEFCSWGIRRE